MPEPRTLAPTNSRWMGLARNVATATLFAVAAGALVWFFAFRGRGVDTSWAVTLAGGASGPAPSVGRPAPDFRAFDLDGAPVQLSALRGHPVWLTFWASWCPPCRAESPDIQAAYQQYRQRGLVIVAVDRGEDPATVRDYAKRAGLGFIFAGDPAAEVAGSYRVTGLPIHFFIDADGVLRDQKLGTLDKKSIQQELARILPQSTTIAVDAEVQAK
jgi:peroxiredoxin